MVQEFHPPIRRQSRLRFALQAAGGMFAVLIGLCVVLYIYAFAGMVSPRYVGFERWAIILQKMLLTPSVIPVSLGGLMIVSGGAIAVISLRQMMVRGISDKRPAGLVVMVVLLICAAALLAIAGIFM